MSDQLYNKAYKYLLASIRLGRYPDGCCLPSIPELCGSLDVSRITIHNALKMLQEEGFVSLCQGRSAVVTYSAQPEACRDRYIAYCQGTRDALLDLSGLFLEIWPEALAQGLRLCGGRDLAELERTVSEMPQRVEYPYLEVYARILRQLGNPLLVNLYASTAVFGQCTAIRLEAQVRRRYLESLRETSLQVLSLRRAGDYGRLKQTLRALYGKRLEVVRLFCAALPPADGPVEPVPFRWNYYTKRPSVRFDLTMKLLREIYAADGRMEYLPSVARLSRQYSIPVITVRRAIRSLCDIGAVETVNGRGTRVLVGSGKTVERARLSDPSLKKALLPYLQSVQILLLFSRDVALAMFPSFREEAIRTAAGRLREILASGDCTLTLGAVFSLLLDSARSPALREILGVLLQLQYLGYPLRDMEPNEFRYDPGPTGELLEGLERGDGERFAAGLQRLMDGIFQAGKEKLRSGGIREAEELALPALP